MPRNALIKLSYEIYEESSNKKFPSVCDPSKLKKNRVGTHEGQSILVVWIKNLLNN